MTMMMMVTDPVRIIWEITTIIDHTTTIEIDLDQSLTVE